MYIHSHTQHTRTHTHTQHAHAYTHTDTHTHNTHTHPHPHPHTMHMYMYAKKKYYEKKNGTSWNPGLYIISPVQSSSPVIVYYQIMHGALLTDTKFGELCFK